MSFTITKLAGNRALIRGTDTTGASGQTVLDSTEWDNVKQHWGLHEKGDAYENALAEFFAPLNEALAEIEGSQAPVVDDLFQVVFTEGSEGQAEVAAEVAHLGTDSAILRLIESDPTAPRLVWVTPEQLEILAVDDVSLGAVQESGFAVPTDLDPETISGITDALAASLGVEPENIHYIGGTILPKGNDESDQS